MTMHRGFISLIAVGAMVGLVLSQTDARQADTSKLSPSAAARRLLGSYQPITDEILLHPRSENWISFRNGAALWGYSGLKQINASNVGKLQLVWARGMPEGPQQVEPFVYNGVMFLLQARDLLQALDATTGDLLWEYRRDLPADIGTVTGTSYRFRNVALYGDKVFLATQDACIVALDARTGKKVWEIRRGDYRDKLSATTGPIIAAGRLILGSRCDPAGKMKGGCFISAYDVRNGKEIWRVNTIARPGEPGGDSWGDLPIDERRDVSPWMEGSYDPELNLVFWGTGITQLGRDDLKGAPNADLLFTNSTLAIDPITGKRVWYLQHLPRDYRAMDHAYERMIVETQVAPSPQDVPWISPAFKPGERRKVLTGIFGKTGIVWTLDAKTGAFLWARPTVYQNIMLGWDHKTNRPIVSEPVAPPEGQDDPVMSCPPSSTGGKNEPSGSYSPMTDAMYMPLNNLCASVPARRLRTPPSTRAVPGFGAIVGSPTYVPGADPATASIGRLEAISASTGKTLWKHEQRAPIYGSVLATGGNLVFSGDAARRFRALNAENGKVLWETILQGQVSGRPMTYSVDGRQYVAIGAGGDSYGGFMLPLTPELSAPNGSNALFVFALEP